MRTVHAEDGVEAVQTVFRTQPDAVILDVQMPRVSGYVAARVLKDDWQTADIPVILLTSLDAATDRYWGALVGADRFLSKDFEAPQLVAAVRDVIAAADRRAVAGPGWCPTRSSWSTTTCTPASATCSTASCSRRRCTPRSPRSRRRSSASRTRSRPC